ncbi:MAG: hypothetical protein Q9213_001835 [Squamulea squamosa]
MANSGEPMAVKGYRANNTHDLVSIRREADFQAKPRRYLHRDVHTKIVFVLSFKPSQAVTGDFNKTTLASRSQNLGLVRSIPSLWRFSSPKGTLTISYAALKFPVPPE